MTKRPLVLSLTLVVTLFGVLGGYYWIHKPITPASAVALANVIADVSVAVWLTTLGGGLGRRGLRGWAGLTIGERLTAGERLTVEVALGWGAMGLFMLGLGAANLYYALLLWGLGLIVSLFLWREMRAWMRDVGKMLRDVRPAFQAAPWAAWALGLVFSLSLLRALTPPVKWDALVYHLTLPKFYAQTHGLQLPLDFMFSGMPQLTEMLYLAALLLRSATAAQTLGWMFGALLALGLTAHASAVVGPRFAVVAPTVLFVAYTLSSSLAWAYADLLLMFLALALLITLRQWRTTQEHRWLLLSGGLAGLAMGCKYTAVLLPFAAGVVVLWGLFRMRAPLTQYQGALVFGAVAVGVFSPWLIKNFALTGNPVYPLLIPTDEMDALRQQFYSRPDLADRNPLWAGLIFFRALFGGVQGGNEYDATLNPFLAFLPLALGVGWRRLADTVRRELAPVAVFVLPAYCMWAALTLVTPLAEQARLFFALFPALALLGAGGYLALTAFDAPTLRVSFILNMALALVCALSVWEYSADFARHSPLAYLFGQQTQADYERENLGWYAPVTEAIQALPAEARVLFLWEPRAFGCEPIDRCAPDVVIDRWWHLRRTLGGRGSILARWQAQGFTHVLLYLTGVQVLQGQPNNGYRPSDWAELETLQTQLRLVHDFGGVYQLYALP